MSLARVYERPLGQIGQGVGDRSAPDSGWPYLLLGLVGLVFGVLLVTGDPSSAIGWLVVAASQTLVAIGTVAVGVTVGLMRADYRRQDYLD